MRKPLIAANWKMNKTVEESVSFINKFKVLVNNKVEIVICPPFTALEAISKELKGNLKLGAQNIHFEEQGAFTGEISPLMLKEICNYVILGHSERRQFFNEDNELINKKIKSALKNNLKIILCIGENLEQRESNETMNIIENQVNDCLNSISDKEMKNIVIAYEPIWAIGTGKTATPEQAQEVHKNIRQFLEKKFNKNISDSTRILYGGSVKPDNIKELMHQEDIDGALVGGASLDPESFANICNF